MNRIVIALAVAVFAAGSAIASPAAAPPEIDIMAAVNQFVDGFNKGDTKAMIAACADETSIIDEFPPYEWYGSGACAKWVSDFNADAVKNGITDGAVTLAKPRHVDVAANRAYVVAQANFTFKQKGQPVAENGSTLTIALHKSNAGWHITGWAWAKS